MLYYFLQRPATAPASDQEREKARPAQVRGRAKAANSRHTPWGPTTSSRDGATVLAHS